MKFANPQWLWTLLLVPLFLSLLVWDFNRRKEQFEKFVSSSVWGKILPEANWGARIIKSVLISFSFAMIILALARPQWGRTEEKVSIEGLDVMLVFDVSASMLVEDVAPNRLMRAKHFASSFLSRLRNDRVGIVAFAGSSYLASPLTTDMGYLQEMIDTLDPEIIANQGTNLGAALETAVEALDRGSEVSLDSSRGNEAPSTGALARTSKVIVMISDGENLEGDLSSSLDKVKSSGAKVFIFGIGTERGGKIPVRIRGSLRHYKRDLTGQEILSRFDPKALMGVASTTGGRYWTILRSEDQVSELLGIISGLQRDELEQNKIVRYQERFQIPLALALLFILLELSIPVRRAVAGLLAFFMINGDFLYAEDQLPQGSSMVSDLSNSLEVYRHNEQGLRAYEQDQLGLARDAFGEAHARDPQSPELIYNQSVIQAREKRNNEAIEGFRESLEGAIETDNAELEQKSLYNLAILLSQERNFKEAAQNLAQGLQKSQEKGSSQMEQKFRQALQQLQQQMMQQGKGQGKKEGKEKGEGEGDGDRDRDKQDKDPGDIQHPQYQSQKLNKEDAEKVIDDLTREEKKIQMRLMKKKGDYQSGGKEW